MSEEQARAITSILTLGGNISFEDVPRESLGARLGTSKLYDAKQMAKAAASGGAIGDDSIDQVDATKSESFSEFAVGAGGGAIGGGAGGGAGGGGRGGGIVPQFSPAELEQLCAECEDLDQFIHELNCTSSVCMSNPAFAKPSLERRVHFSGTPRSPRSPRSSEAQARSGSGSPRSSSAAF